MKNIYLNIYKPNLANLKKAKKNLENNNIIGIPTEKFGYSNFLTLVPKCL